MSKIIVKNCVDELYGQFYKKILSNFRTFSIKANLIKISIETDINSIEKSSLVWGPVYHAAHIWGPCVFGGFCSPLSYIFYGVSLAGVGCRRH